MQEYPVFRSEEEYLAYVLKELEESEREAADPNTVWIPWREVLREGDAFLRELEYHRAAKSA